MNKIEAKNNISALFVLPSLARSGAEIQVVNTIKRIGNKFDKSLFSFEFEQALFDELSGENINYFSYLRKFKFDIRPALYLSKILEEKKINVIHATLNISLLYTVIAKLISNIKPKIIFALHTTKNRKKLDNIYDKIIYKKLFKYTNKIICVCKNQEKYFLDNYPFLKRKTIVVYNGIDVEYYDPQKTVVDGIFLRKRLGISYNDHVISCIAAMRPEKGHEYLIKSFRNLISENPNTWLLLAGSGELENKLKRQVYNLNLNKKVIFLGSVDDVRPILSAANVAVLPSICESFPMAMLESMAMGVPLVASNVGGISEAIINKKTGILVKPKNIEELTCSLKYIIKQNELRKTIGEESRRAVIKNFTVNKMVESIKKIIIESVEQ